jgi:hypothetical protein
MVLLRYVRYCAGGLTVSKYRVRDYEGNFHYVEAFDALEALDSVEDAICVKLVTEV